MLVNEHTIKTTLPIISIKSDTIIFEEGWDDHKMFFILDGVVKIYNERDYEEIEVAMIKKHEFFGEIEMYCKHPRSTSAKMITDVELVVIRNPVELEQFTRDNTWLAGKMMKTMGSRLAIANDLLIKRTTSQMAAPASPVLEVTKDNTIRRIIRH
jgi:CRP/FNR family transcriptional regulator, cyclic AMP receptor protein